MFEKLKEYMFKELIYVLYMLIYVWKTWSYMYEKLIYVL